MLLQFCALGVTMSWDEGFLGARASRPHQAWHSLGHLPHLDRPGTEPWLSFGWAVAVPADRVAACKAARKLSDHHKEQHAGGTPALPGSAVLVVPWGVSGGRLLRMPTCTPWETPVCPPARPPPCRAAHSRKNGRSLVKTNHKWTRINTNRPEDRGTSLNPKRHRNASAIWCPWCDDVMG